MASMRELFPEFYLDSLEVSDLNREKSNLIVFDSNFLLDILRLPTEIAEKYLEAIEKVKEHIFIPYLVGVEFNFNKKKIKIETQEHLNIYQDKVKKVINEKVEYTYNQLLESLLEEKSINFLKNKNQKINALNEIKKGIDSYHKLVLDEKEKLIESLCTNIVQRYSTDLDVLSNRVVELIGQSVAPKLEQEFIEKVQEEGQKRYDDKIPPGFDDRDEKAGKLRRYSDLVYDTQYGDYIIWEEILHKVAVEGNNIGQKVIFVTSDGNSKEKHDIMYSVKGKKVGPYIQMVNELYELRDNYSLIGSNDGEKLNKELYIIDGFRFMQLANNLNDSVAKQYEVEPFFIHKNISKNQILDLSKDIDVVKNSEDLILNLLKDEFFVKEGLSALEELTVLEENLRIAKTEEEVNRLIVKIRSLRRKLRRLKRKQQELQKVSNLEIQEYDLKKDWSRKRDIKLESLMLEFKKCRQDINRIELLIAEETDIDNIKELNKIIENLKLVESTLSKEIARFSDDFYGDI